MAGAMVSGSDALRVNAGLLESVTMNVTETAVTITAGSPASTPLAAFSDKPSPGAKPLTSDQVYGAVPPVAASVADYAAPTWPEGSDVVAMDTDGGGGGGGGGGGVRGAPGPGRAD